MSNKEENILKAMEKAIKFIRKLDEEQLEGLVKDNLIFDIIPKKSNKKKVKKEVVSDDSKSDTKTKKSKKKEAKFNEEKINKLKEIADDIKEFSTREEAVNYINSVKKPKLTKDDLLFIGKQLGIIIPKSRTKDVIINIIVEETVGNKLKVESIRKAIMGKEEEKI